MSQTYGLTRLHAFDALRAAMMLLGIVLHAAASYVVTPLGEAWPYKDPATNPLFDLVMFVIHLFRMPAFFLTGGFFAALVYERRGPGAFLAHRARRLLLPLALAWPVVIPPTAAGFFYVAGASGSNAYGDILLSFGRAPFATAALGHLWFLYYLFLLCAAAVAVAPFVRTLPARWHAAAIAGFGQLTPSLSGCLALGLLSGLTMLPMMQPGLDTSASIVPAARLLIAYGVFFVAGWLLFLRRDRIAAFEMAPMRYLSLGSIVTVAALAVVVNPMLLTPSLNHAVPRMLAGVAIWLLVYGVTGLFVRYASHPCPLARYLSDASYWMYLTHLPMVVWTARLLGPVGLPAAIKFGIVVILSAGVTLATYDLLVRSTVIGVLLNGQRFPRGLPPRRVAGP